MVDPLDYAMQNYHRRSKRRVELAVVALNTKTCVCGANYTRGDKESYYQFERRKYCGIGCSARMAKRPGRTPIITRTCKGCGETFHRGANETAKKFHNRFYCNDDCKWSNWKRKTQTAAPHAITDQEFLARIANPYAKARFAQILADRQAKAVQSA